jgi:hypothetical protein
MPITGFSFSSFYSCYTILKIKPDSVAYSVRRNVMRGFSLLIVVFALLVTVTPILAQDTGPGDTLPLDLGLREPINGEVVQMTGEGRVNSNENNTIVDVDLTGQNQAGEPVSDHAHSTFNEHNTNSFDHWTVGGDHCFRHSHRNRHGLMTMENGDC